MNKKKNMNKKFTNCLCFYVVAVYGSLAPQQTKEEAKTFAAMSACNGMHLFHIWT